MGMEIERKFTIKHLPDDVDSYEYHIIEQAYLTTEPVIHIRREDGNDERIRSVRCLITSARARAELRLNA